MFPCRTAACSDPRYRASDYISVSMGSRGPSNSTTTPSTVLIVRPTALGDVCRTVPALATLRRALPRARIDWLVHESFQDAVRHHPALDEVICFPRQRFATMAYNLRAAADAWEWAKQLRQRRYDLAIDLQGLVRSGLLTFLTGSSNRVGFANARELGWLGYNRRYRIDRDLHSVDRMLGLIDAHGYEPIRDTRLYLGPDDRRWLQARLEQSEHQPYAAIAPTARWRCKCWPIDRYGELIERLLERRDLPRPINRAVVLATPKEESQIEPLRQRFAGERRVEFARTNVGQLMAVISGCNLLVCNDSAPLHMGVGFARPLVTIFGPTNPRHVGPYCRGETIVQPTDIQASDMKNYRRHRHNQTLIAKVSIDEVWQKILEQLAHEPPAGTG